MTRLNWKTRVPLPNVYLVPYRTHHVETYHTWMMDPQLLEATASEPLTMDEEFENQQSWRDDPTKLTFIVVDRDSSKPVGDVNVFLHDGEENNLPEIDIMIAEPNARRKGLAKQACAGMMLYARDKLAIKTFVAKISLNNEPSMKLFEKLGFTPTYKDEAFKQTTMTSGASTFAICAKLAGLPDATTSIPTEVDIDTAMELLRERGNKAFHNNDFVNAIKWFDMGLGMDWMDHILLSNRSVARLRQGDFYGAIIDAASAVALDPTYLKARYRLAASWAAVGLIELGKQAYKDAQVAFPEQAISLQQLSDKLSPNRDPRVQSSPRYSACLALLPKFVAVQCSTPHPPSVLLGEVLYMWKRLSGAEKAGLFDLYCEISGSTPTDVPTPQQWNELKTKAQIPGAMDESKLPKPLVNFLSAGISSAPDVRMATVELLFSSCSVEQRGKIAEVLIALVVEALKV